MQTIQPSFNHLNPKTTAAKDAPMIKLQKVEKPDADKIEESKASIDKKAEEKVL